MFKFRLLHQEQVSVHKESLQSSPAAGHTGGLLCTPRVSNGNPDDAVHNVKFLTNDHRIALLAQSA